MPEIHQLPNSNSLTGAELFPTSQDVHARKCSLDDIAAFLNYQNTSVVASNNSGSPVEIGSSKTNITVSWTVGPNGRIPVSQTFGGSSIASTDRSKIIAGPITTNTTWTITATDSKPTTGTGSTTLEFRYKRYYGVSANATLTDPQIIALSSDLGTQSRTQTRQIVCSNEYIYFAWPDSWGGATSSSFTVNGLLNTAWIKVRNDSFTNASGNTYNIGVFRSSNLLTGTFNLGVS
jgi:hypothetical protein